MEPLKAIDSDKAVFQMTEGYSPVMISAGEGFIYVIMPVRTKQ
jgi:DNA polymerase III sliding clamp (beta) subunit (PCNA family)